MIVTDAWKPQVNGVVTTLGKTRDTMIAMSHDVMVIEPSKFKTVPCPTYPEIRLAINPNHNMRCSIESYQPTHIHIATEGPLGLAARHICLQNDWAFTTSYHTQFPEYIRERIPLPLKISYAYYRWFHSKASHTLVGTPHLKKLLEQRGFKNIALWSRGVDTTTFKPKDKNFLDYPRPIWVYVGRVSVEKNIEEFLRLDLPGTKVVIGHGPALEKLSQQHTEVKFEGYRFGDELASYISAGDVFVFPSVTDTFGIVMLEAMACGLPVAAFPVTGPMDVVRDGITGSLNEDLKTAALNALKLNPQDCLDQGQEYTWTKATDQFVKHLTPICS